MSKLSPRSIAERVRRRVRPAGRALDRLRGLPRPGLARFTPVLVVTLLAWAVGGTLIAWAFLNTPTSQPEPDRPGASRAGGVPAVVQAGPGIDAVGIALEATPDRFGDVEVVERIIARGPTKLLRLSAPPRLEDSDGAKVQLVDLRVTADGVTVPVRWPGALEKQRVRLPEPATVFVLRYRVFGADARDVAAPSGRATLSLRPAAYASFPALPAVVGLKGAVVHNLVCLDEPDDEQLCGVDGGSAWRTLPVPARTSRVLALVDLPATA